MTSIVLAGGCSTRLGREKSRELIGGESMLGLVVERLARMSDEVLIVVSRSQTVLPFLPGTGVRTVVDLYPGTGSLGGIYTGLVHSGSFQNVAVACDMPFLKLDLLRYMIGLSPDFDVVMPTIDGRREPLHAVYTKKCLRTMEMQLKGGNLKARDFPELVRTRYVEKEELDRFDPEHLSFFNVNTQDDLDAARMLASREVAAGHSAGCGREGG